jgi:hypothetical protein
MFQDSTEFFDLNLDLLLLEEGKKDTQPALGK